MLKMLRSINKDLTELFLVLLTGAFAGSIFTLAYIKFLKKGDVTFADIGGMLSGAGTVGLLVLACFTARSWKEQIIESAKRDSLEQFYVAGTKAFWTMMLFLRKLEDIEYAKRQGNHHSTMIQDQTREKNSQACAEYTHAVAKLDLSWEVGEFTGILPIDVVNLFNKIEELHKKETFTISFTESKKLITGFQKEFHNKYNSIKKHL
ncbi:hypothetical protein [Marinomonas spartinae]|uniref:hypothetical protein n=1 Tax=Marinomonas spartinae TaxID=1792290 RepID=UPI0018F267B7|nr:hypothetical protein [Marinomonas spartinae]MBJ7555375.1 hypothetical protein [Marinomonas spartinae]